MNAWSVTPRTSSLSKAASAIACRPASDVFAHRLGNSSREARTSPAVGVRDGRTTTAAASASRRAIVASSRPQVAVPREPQVGRVDRADDRPVAVEVRRCRMSPRTRSVGVLALPNRGSPWRWRSGGGRRGWSASGGALGAPRGVAVRPVRQEGRDRGHFMSPQKAEASSPRSVRIAPRRARRIPGEMS